MYLIPTAVILLAVNIVAFIAYGLDKRKAKRGAWRISEATLLLLALLGGALGAWLGMKAFHHKTKHWKFRILVPLLLVVWLAMLACFVVRVGVPGLE